MKREWRERGQKILSEFDLQKKRNIEESMRELLFSSSLWKEATHIGVTLSSSLEWDTRMIVQNAWAQGKVVCVPKTIPSRKGMAFYILTDFDQCAVGHFGMEEPIPEKTKQIPKEQIDLLLVPGLMYNQQGYRVGFGGGYYDRFLMDYPNTTVSLLHSSQLSDRLPVEEHDVPVDYIVTEKACWKTQK